MVSIRPDDYSCRTENAQATEQTTDIKTKPTAIPVGKSETMGTSDAVEIKTPDVDIDPTEVERSQWEQQNKALELRENVELETYKDDLRNAISGNNSFAKSDALDSIAKIENQRITWDRCSEDTQNLCIIISRSLMGADVSEELEDLSVKDRKIYNDVKKELSKVSVKNRSKIPQKLVLFYIKKANGDYSGYTPKESRDLVEARMYKETIQNAPIIALELKDMLPSRERAAASNQAYKADTLRQETIDLTNGYDPSTGKWMH